MKIRTLTILTGTILFLAGFATKRLCDSMQFVKGTTFEMETYTIDGNEGKDRKMSVNKQVVKEITTNGNTKEALIHTVIFDSQSEKQHEGDLRMICDGNTIKIDFQNLINNSKFPGAEYMQIKMDQGFMEFPLNPAVGQSLPDVNMNMHMSDKNSGQEMGNTKIVFTDRKVEGKEKVTTPAGTFDCWKVSSNMKIEIHMMGMNNTMPGGKSINYYNKEVGPVKSENYKSSAELQSYTILTKYKKP